MRADDYQSAGLEVSFMCAGEHHERCPGSMVDPLWKRRACACACHGGAVCFHGVSFGMACAECAIDSMEEGH